MVDSIADLNERLAAADVKDAYRSIANRPQTVGYKPAFERTLLRALPTGAFPTWLTLTPRVDRHARVKVRQRQYSVSVRLIGRQVRVHLGSSSVTVFDGSSHVAAHERVVSRGRQSLVLERYLQVLARSPGALPCRTALVRAARRARSPRRTTSAEPWPTRRECRHSRIGRGLAAAPHLPAADVEEGREVLVLPSVRLLRGRSLRAPLPAGPSPDLSVYLST